MTIDEAVLAATASIAGTYLTQNRVSSVGELGRVLKDIYQVVLDIAEPVVSTHPVQPAVNPKKSVSPDAIISLIDGKPYKMLTRHIKLHGYTPATYRETFGLKPDYPMVAPSYAAVRSDMAKKFGLGRKAA